MKLQTIVYRYLRKNGVPYSKAWKMAKELVEVVGNYPSSTALK